MNYYYKINLLKKLNDEDNIMTHVFTQNLCEGIFVLRAAIELEPISAVEG